MRYLEHAFPDVASNLALDEALLEEVEATSGPPVLRLWEPATTAVVLGASGRLQDEVRGEACRADGVVIARRSSGGGTVVIGPGVVNVAVVLPSDFAPGLGAVDEAQRFVLERFAEALRPLVPGVEVLGSGDLTLSLRKFAGSAQRRLRHHFLVHATFLNQFPLDAIDRYTHLPGRQPAYRAGRSHAEFVINLGLPRPDLRAALQSAWAPDQGLQERMAVPEERVRHLVATKFGTSAWVERL